MSLENSTDSKDLSPKIPKGFGEGKQRSMIEIMEKIIHVLPSDNMITMGSNEIARIAGISEKAANRYLLLIEMISNYQSENSRIIVVVKEKGKPKIMTTPKASNVPSIVM